ncbi:MAG: LysR family transcriptional regulator [Rhodospirillum sp.]|nr:LysR family transcriptional regulator [Rhodospirillum sp.]MCF8490447.1 LysR family transcriptional regulator [Rhodospirillum sp.]MCF8500460.1 LysR family transcriptional regulator [Rhodospirillum sp.]
MESLRTLRAFCLTVEEGSFAGAARRLGLTPAAVGKMIAGLEADHGVRLFHRTTRRMSPTQAGLEHHRRIFRVLEDLEDANRALDPQRDRPSGSLLVSAPMTLGLTHLSPMIPGFLSRYPEITLDLRLDDRRVDIIGEGFDLAIRGKAALEDSDLVARPLMTLHHVVCASPSYLAVKGVPKTAEDLTGHDLIRFSLSGHADAWRFTKGDHRVLVPVRSRYAVTNSLAIRDALLAGLGLSLIPEVYVRADLEAGRLKAVLADWSMIEITVYAIYPSRRLLSPKVRVFLDYLGEGLDRKPLIQLPSAAGAG